MHSLLDISSTEGILQLNSFGTVEFILCGRPLGRRFLLVLFNRINWYGFNRKRIDGHWAVGFC
jgi:hypothetical protein